MNSRKVSPKFFDKELGWLLFNERVLELSETTSNPLLERLNFHNIFHSNLDEFFMKRVGKLRATIKKIEAKDPLTSKVSKTYLQSLLEKVNELSRRSLHNLSEDLIPALEKNGVFFTTPDCLSFAEKKWLRETFEKKVFPLLTPLVVDSGHPFPLISNLSHSLGFVVRRPNKTQRHFLRVKIPPFIPLWILIPQPGNKNTFVNLLDVVQNFQEEILPKVEIDATFNFRVIRSLEINKKDGMEEAEDLLELMAEEIRARRYSEIVRFEYSGVMHNWARNYLQRELNIKNEDFVQYSVPLTYKKFDAPCSLKIPRLRFKPFKPIVAAAFQKEESIFDVVARNDVLVHHPYESFSSSVEAFINEAADDPNVLSIKMTLYRAGSQSPIIEALSRAALNGKSVVCLVELKARLDEERNIQWAKKLEAAGVHVIYGVLDLKTHAKITVVVRKENDSLVAYSHVGTGNYNGQTARLYTDLGLFTCQNKLARELMKGFNYLTGMAGGSEFKQILVSPLNLKQNLIEMIEKEALLAAQGKTGKIIIKVNNFDDVDVAKALYKASQAGVDISLIIRGYSILIPQIKGLSENVRIVSILGRHLEHSRIYYFGDGRKKLSEGRFFMGSSDMMRRSFHERVELVAPVESQALKDKLWDYLELMLDEKCSRWEMQTDGTYKRFHGKNYFDIHTQLIESFTK